MALSQQVTGIKKVEFQFNQMHRDGSTPLLELASDLCAISSTYCLARANGLLYIAAIQDRNSSGVSDCCHLSPAEAHLDILVRGVGRRGRVSS